MARKAREKSESGMYHVVLKGNDKLLFAEDDDYRYFLSLLSKTAERDYLETYAYCLFSEIAHLVLKEGLRGSMQRKIRAQRKAVLRPLYIRTHRVGRRPYRRRAIYPPLSPFGKRNRFIPLFHLRKLHNQKGHTKRRFNVAVRRQCYAF